MMRVVLMLSAIGLGGLLTSPAMASTTAGKASPPTLIAIRAAHHPGYDRLVFQFRGRLPAQRSVRYVSKVIADPSGKVVPVAGSARLLVRFFAATAKPALDKRAFAFPGLIELVNAGKFEDVLRYGIGVARKEPIHVFTLTDPNRLVIDLRTPYRTVPVRVYFIYPGNFAPIKESPNFTCVAFACAVIRPVIPATKATGAMQRLFAGPTPAESSVKFHGSGLEFISSDATGFKNLRIRDHVARVQLTGGCRDTGIPGVADEIMPTLKQFRSVRWVKIYDPAGHTERPAGHSDSIPTCLEPT